MTPNTCHYKTWYYDQQEILGHDKTFLNILTNKGMIKSNEISLNQGDDVKNNEGKVAEF